MELKIGTVVFSKAGRDKGKPLAVVKIAQDVIYVCDGKERPLDRPKMKNPKHLAITNYVLSDKETASNRSLKKALRKFACQNEREAE